MVKRISVIALLVVLGFFLSLLAIKGITSNEKLSRDEYIARVADRVVYQKDTEWEMDIDHFDWVPGVGIYGIWKAYEKTGNEEYYTFLTEWADRHLMEAYDLQTVNSTAPMLTVLHLYEKSGNERYLKVCRDIADNTLSSAPITVDGGLEHTVTEAHADFGNQMWADTLFMSCIFLAKLGEVTGEEKYTEFAIEQVKVHHEFLSDGEGLYFHGWDGNGRNHMSAVRWGRANAWLLYSTAEILEIVGDFSGREVIEENVRKHAEALAKVQARGGGFRTILDDSSSYVEVSATAGIAAGLKKAIKMGIVDETYCSVADDAAFVVCNAIEDNGDVNGVSTGTPIMESAQAYKEIPTKPTLYGQALALLALCEK